MEENIETNNGSNDYYSLTIKNASDYDDNDYLELLYDEDIMIETNYPYAYKVFREWNDSRKS